MTRCTMSCAYVLNIVAMSFWCGCGRAHVENAPIGDGSPEGGTAVVVDAEAESASPELDADTRPPADASTDAATNATLVPLGPRRPGGTVGERGYIVKEGNTCNLPIQQAKHELLMCCNGRVCRGVCRLDPGWSEPRCICAMLEGGCTAPHVCCGYTCANPDECDKMPQ